MKLYEYLDEVKNKPEDFVAHNLELAKTWSNPFTPSDLRKVYDRQGLRPFMALFACTGCGESHIQAPIVKFYNFDIRQVKCYTCQGMNYGN